MSVPVACRVLLSADSSVLADLPRREAGITTGLCVIGSFPSSW